MNIYKISALLIVMLFFTLACATPKGYTPEEKRDYIQKMEKDTLNRLFKVKPDTKKNIKKAAGYAVFSNVETKIFFIGTGRGYGVLTDSETGKKTYMRMMSLGGGLGLGISDFRAVFLFKNDRVMKEFVEKGWTFGGDADAAVKSGDKGGAVSGEILIDENIEIYQLTESGIAASAMVNGTKYWKDKDLN